MNEFAIIYSAVNLGIWFILLALLIYLIIRRIKIKKVEDFENRDN